MDTGASQAGENGVPLPELLAFGFHKHLLFANGYCLRPYSSTGFSICQEVNANNSHLFLEIF
jgi:hypothetical protein